MSINKSSKFNKRSTLFPFCFSPCFSKLSTGKDSGVSGVSGILGITTGMSEASVSGLKFSNSSFPELSSCLSISSSSLISSCFCFSSLSLCCLRASSNEIRGNSPSPSPSSPSLSPFSDTSRSTGCATFERALSNRFFINNARCSLSFLPPPSISASCSCP